LRSLERERGGAGLLTLLWRPPATPAFFRFTQFSSSLRVTLLYPGLGLGNLESRGCSGYSFVSAGLCYQIEFRRLKAHAFAPLDASRDPPVEVR